MRVRVDGLRIPLELSLQSKSKHAEIRQLLILEWIKTNKLTMQWQPEFVPGKP